MRRGSLTFAEVAFVIFYRIKITFAFGAVFPNIFWEVYGDFILQVKLPLESRYLRLQ